MTVRRVLPTDVAGLSWLDGGTRTGLVAAADAGTAVSATELLRRADDAPLSRKIFLILPATSPASLASPRVG